MKRTITHLLVSLLTFSCGLALAWLVSPVPKPLIDVSPSPSQLSTQPVMIQENITPSSIVAESSIDNSIPINPGDKRVICKDRTIALVWKQLIETKDFWEYANPTFEEFDCADMFQATKLDLNSDGVAEIKIRGQYGNHCGATGNCSEWIFGKDRKTGRYRVILDSGGEHFAIKRTANNGYRDIYIRTHDSASSSYHMVYKFSGTRYFEARCWFSEYHSDGSFETMSCKEKSKQYEDNQ